MRDLQRKIFLFKFISQQLTFITQISNYFNFYFLFKEIIKHIRVFQHFFRFKNPYTDHNKAWPRDTKKQLSFFREPISYN